VCVGSRSYELKKKLDKTTEAELICYPPRYICLLWYLCLLRYTEVGS